MFRFYFFVIFFLVTLTDTILCGDRQITVCDLWNGMPLKGVNVESYSDTSITKTDGVFILDKVPVRLSRKGYFDLTINSFEFSGSLIYMEPVQNTELITVVRSKESDSRLMLPAHISRIDYDDHRYGSMKNLDKLLSAESGIFVKSYGGQGQLQTISIRGMSSEQTQLLFDGIPINGLQLGSADLGQYGAGQVGSLEIYRGGSALFGGSGAIGGSVNLHPEKPSDRIGYEFNAGLGSFNTSNYGLSVDLPFKNYRQKITIEKSSGDNDYTTHYRNADVTLQNRDFERMNLNYYGILDLDYNKQIDIFFSNYRNEAGAPDPFVSPTAESANLARRDDDYTLFKLRFIRQSKKGGYSVQTYVRNEWMGYDDPSVILYNQALHSIHFNRERGLQARGNYLATHHLLVHTGFEGAWQYINSTDAGVHEKRRLAGYLLLDWEAFRDIGRLEAVHLNASARMESDSQFGKVLLPGFGFSANINHTQIYGSVARNYRAPTFNDLYWRPGGNPDLNAEESVNAEMGIDFEQRIRPGIVNINLTGYTNRVDNQIKWLPAGNYWTPENILEVFSRGWEIEIGLSDHERVNSLELNYTRGKSEKSRPEFKGDKTDGNQLPYIPREQWTIRAQTGWKFTRIGFQGTGMGFRYETLQNNLEGILPSNTVWRIWSGFDFFVSGHNLTLNLAMENIFDLDYKLISGYPMPPRQYFVSIRIAR
ncbi:MAG: TonB-dependent receptor plug domain-containing protein [Calditrichaceae bacterium]